jgi:hypothetical protein
VRIVVHVAEAELRGVPFNRYVNVLDSLIIEMYTPDEVTVSTAEETRVVVVDAGEDQDPSFIAGDVLEMTRTITLPENYDGLFR